MKPVAGVAKMNNPIENCRKDFPILQQLCRDKPLVYLDSAATSQKPQRVIDAVNHYYLHDNANVHRGVYQLAERATQQYEAVREKLKNFINAPRVSEIIFTKGTTESINLIASSFGALSIQAGDEIIISEMEHHSNIVPWQLLCKQKGAHLNVIRVKDNGELDLDHFQTLLSPKTKLVSVAHISNVLGTINPIETMIKLAHAKAVPVLIDGAQAVPHLAVDLTQLDCDFYVFSSHKLYGPTGVGVLYGKTEYLDKMPPYQAGGDMIREVSFKETSFNALPYKFEAGTPNIAGVIGLGAALDYVQQWDHALIEQHEQDLLHYATEQLSKISGLKIIGTAPKKIGVISFVMEQAHPHDIATILDLEGVAVRAGHHCAMPLIERFQIPATTRMSLGIYNNKADVDALVLGLEKVIKLFNS